MADQTEHSDGHDEPTADHAESLEVGARVTVSGAGGPALDGIIFDLPSRAKAVVAVMDRKRGPVFRSVAIDVLATRDEEGPNDHALQLLIRRTPGGGRAGGSGRGGTTRGSAGFARPPAHRPTGR